MESETSRKRQQIIETLESKSTVKRNTYTRTFDLFQELKNILHELSGEINDILTIQREVKTEYRDRGKFEAQFQVAGDILIFNMHTNVFRFPPEHPVWQTEYVKQDYRNAYFGVINVFNFLADSFKYNRSNDEGYLIGRIFINHEGYFFAEGKDMEAYGVEHFGKQRFREEAIIELAESLILYALRFELLVPPYETMKVVEAEQMNTKIENSKIQTGKRLGYDFNVEEI